MRRWLFLSFSSTVLLSVIIGLMIAIGRQQPLPERLALLHFDMCEPPCWIGIVPGKTTLGEATQLVTKVYKEYEPHVTFGKGYFVMAKPSPSRLLVDAIELGVDSSGIQKDTDKQIVTDISFFFCSNRNGIIISDLLTILNPPTHIFLWTQNNQQTSSDTILQRNVGNIPTYYIYLEIYKRLKMSENVCTMGFSTKSVLEVRLVPWHGFAAESAYQHQSR